MSDDTRLGAGPSAPMPYRDAMNATLARHWWALALRGLIAVLFGVIALTEPGAVLLSIALFFGIYLLIDGVIGLLSTVRAVTVHGHWVTLLAEAILNLIMGLIALFIPAAAVLAFVLITAVWALMSGGLMLRAAMGLHASHGRWLLAAGGLVSLVWGLMLIVAPMVGAVVLAWWLGVYAIMFGVALSASAWRLKAQQIH